MAYPNWIYSMFSFIGFLMCMIPFPWHLEAWNTGTCLYMAWTGLACLNYFIGSIVWNGNAINWAPVWCDISSRFIIGVNVAVPAASLCINRRLYHISSANTVTVSRAEKRRAVMADLAIGLGIPVLEMVLQYIPQGHRFDIFEDVGCFPFTYNTPVGIVLVTIWPIMIGLVSAVYCVLSIKAFYKRRAQFKELLSSNNNLSTNRYVRLMCLAGVEVLGTIPSGIYVLVINIKMGMSPWKGWADTHYQFSKTSQWPALIWHSKPFTNEGLELSRWSVVACAFIFFAFFGFADEARKNYRAVITTVAKRMGYSSMTSSTLNSTYNGSRWKGVNTSSVGRSLPVFVKKETSRKRDSLDSFTNMSSSLKEKSTFGALSLNDVGGILEYKDDLVPSPSDSSSASSILTDPPAYPSLRPEDDIEISSVRRLSVVSVASPPPVLNLANVPRHLLDTPTVARQNSLDVV